MNISSKQLIGVQIMKSVDKMISDVEKVLITKGDLYKSLLNIVISLMDKKDSNEIFNTVLLTSMAVSRADGGTVYIVIDDHLHFLCAYNRSLNLISKLGSKSTKGLEPIPLYNKKGEYNNKFTSVQALEKKQAIKINNIQETSGYEDSGTKKFDDQYQYSTESMMTIPLFTKNRPLGVVQLVNAQKESSGQIIPFSKEIQECLQIFYQVMSPYLEVVQNNKKNESMVNILWDNADTSNLEAWWKELKEKES